MLLSELGAGNLFLIPSMFSIGAGSVFSAKC